MSLGNNIFNANIYRKVSNLVNPFWGITKNRIDQLSNEPYDYYVQFDFPGGSIVLTSDQVADLLKNKKLASDNEYKISLNDLKKLFPFFL